MPSIDPGDSWTEYRRLVLSELERVSKGQEDDRRENARQSRELRDEIQRAKEELYREIQKARADINNLKIASSAWGAISGAIVAAAAALIAFLRGH